MIASPKTFKFQPLSLSKSLEVPIWNPQKNGRSFPSMWGVKKQHDNKQQKTKKLGLEIIFEENMQISWNAFFGRWTFIWMWYEIVL